MLRYRSRRTPPCCFLKPQQCRGKLGHVHFPDGYICPGMHSLHARVSLLPGGKAIHHRLCCTRVCACSGSKSAGFETVTQGCKSLWLGGHLNIVCRDSSNKKARVDLEAPRN